MLALDYFARKEIETLKRKSEIVVLPKEISSLQMPANWRAVEDIRPMVDQLRAVLQNCTITLGEFVITYTLEEHEFGVARHLSLRVEGPDYQPPRAAIKVLMEEFGFSQPIGRCIEYTESFPKGTPAIHVIEPLEYDERFEGYLARMRPSRQPERPRRPEGHSTPVPMLG